MTGIDKRTEIISELVLLIKSLTKTFFIKERTSEIVIIVPAKIIPEVKAFCLIHQDILGVTYCIPDDVCYIPINNINATIISTTSPINGVLSKGM